MYPGYLAALGGKVMWLLLKVLVGVLLRTAIAGKADSTGCTDSAATNYDPSSHVDDGMCRYTATDLRRALGAPSSTGCYIRGSEGWPQNLTTQPSTVPVEQAVWIVQGKPRRGNPLQPGLVTPGADLLVRFDVKPQARLFLRYVQMVGSPGGGLDGGGVSAQGATVEIWGSVFNEDGHPSRGGAIYAIESSVTIGRTMFTGTQAYCGGAIYFDGKGSSLGVTESIFANTQSTSIATEEGSAGGGAIWASNGAVILSAVAFNDCHAANRLSSSYQGDSLLCLGCTSILINGTTFDPFDKDRTVQYNTSWLATVGGCDEHRCSAGHSCAYSNYSLNCTACPAGTFGTDGLSCAPCAPGYGPDEAKQACRLCPPGYYVRGRVMPACFLSN
eukprot:COSAG02_NODE_3534_length_6598_cov_2.728112_2_plen_387_part_00